MSKGDTPDIAWDDFAKFIRQLSHDLRNQLNAAELQAALINELTEDVELKDEVKRLRQLVSELGTTLQRLATSVAPQRLNRIGYPAADLVQDLREKATSACPELAITWDTKGVAGEVEVDPQLLEEVILELLDNAARNNRADGPLQVEARSSADSLIIVVREPKAAPVNDTTEWGATVLRNVSHGHYGLGLRRARAIIEAHSGKLHAEYDATKSALVTRICLPLQVGG